MKIRFAIFDFDGTLYDTMFFWRTVAETYLQRLGIEPKPTLQDEVHSMSVENSAAFLKKDYHLDLTQEQIIHGINMVIEDFYKKTAVPKPGVPEFLERLKQKGVRMCIATATARYMIEAALERCGLQDYFEEIYSCYDVGHSKHEPIIFRLAMNNFGADRSNLVIFEDALYAAVTAHADGFPVVGIYDPSEKNPDELRSLSDCMLEDFDHTELFWSRFFAENA